jgi:Uma2 family endonuclease
MTVSAAKSPRLESGDRLTRNEFHRRYLASPKIKKAELVEGVVYVASAVGARHAEAHAWIVGWLGAYQSQHPELRLHGGATVFLDADNEVQPDACLWREEPFGPRLNNEGYIEGAPQVIAEVAVSSASYDLHDKLHAYRRAGVREYIVWRVEDAAIDRFRLHEGAYEQVPPDENGVIESVVFPGLRLDVANMLAGNLAGVLALLGRPIVPS